MKKISCGGFSIDESTLKEENGVLKVIGGGGGSLPAVTSADEGKVLAVDSSGEWGAEHEEFRFNLLYDDVGEIWYTNTDAGDIEAAINSGKVCVAYLPSQNGIGIAGGEYRLYYSGRFPFMFNQYYMFSNSVLLAAEDNFDSVIMVGIRDNSSGQYVGAPLVTKHFSQPFIVTLTPDSPDYSGTMDKTVAEINEAYEAGRKIVFRIYASASAYMDVDCTYRGGYVDDEYPSFNASLVTTEPFDAFIYLFTGVTDDGTKNNYNTIIYPLTPMS